MAKSLEGHGAPTKKTVGSVGQTYTDLDTGIEYVCVEAYKSQAYKLSKEYYNWEKLGINVKTLIDVRVEGMDYLATDEEVAEAIKKLKTEIEDGGTGGLNIYADIID